MSSPIKYIPIHHHNGESCGWPSNLKYVLSQEAIPFLGKVHPVMHFPDTAVKKNSSNASTSDLYATDATVNDGYVSKFGFCLASGEFDASLLTSESGTSLADMTILEAALGNHVTAVNLVQHLIVVFDKKVPDFVDKSDGKLKVSLNAVLKLVDSGKMVLEPLVTRKGFRGSWVLPDGFVLADTVASTVIEVNNNSEIAVDIIDRSLREKAIDKAFDYLGFVFRQWLMEVTSDKLWHYNDTYWLVDNEA